MLKVSTANMKIPIRETIKEDEDTESVVNFTDDVFSAAECPSEALEIDYDMIDLKNPTGSYAEFHKKVVDVL